MSMGMMNNGRIWGEVLSDLRDPLERYSLNVLLAPIFSDSVDLH